MTKAAPLTEIWRGDLLESLHRGHVAVVDEAGQLIWAQGDPEALIYPRSSCKMIQGLPLVTSGAADRYGLTPEHLALACASHNAAQIHLDRVGAWMEQLGLEDEAFCCGPQESRDTEVREAMIRAHESPCRIHNNCSGKHAGFLTLTQYMRASADYVAIDHPVQQAVRADFDQLTGVDSPGYAPDGCSAPNFQTTVTGLARAMAWFARVQDGSGRLESAGQRLREAMIAHPDLVAGEGRACTRLMRACQGRAAIKTGAEGVFIAILPEQRLGIALKIEDGATRAAECAIAALLVRYGALDPAHPEARAYLDAPIQNWDGLVTGVMKAGAALR
ncbi:MAG: asparaginase [Rhodobacteraceae bacterium]|nr:asparaginase [Paracoccaceae bacterium]